MFDFEPNFDFNLKNINIKKSIIDTIKSVAFKRLMTVIIYLSIYITILSITFSILDISLETISDGFIDGVEQFEIQPTSPYLNNTATSIIVLLLPIGIIFIIAFWVLKYKRIDEKYFNLNKKVYNAKVIILPSEKKFFKQKNRFFCIEILINEENKKNPIALIELPYSVENENIEISVEYLIETNEARLIK